MPRVKSRQNSLLDDASVPPPIRTGGRVKKAKIVFDPSINNMPRTRSKRSVSSGQIGFGDKSSGSAGTGSVSPPKFKKIKTENEMLEEKKLPALVAPQINDCCMICEKLESKKGRKLIPCQDCSYKVHPSCLKVLFQDQSLLEQHWRCSNCTTCVVCYETSEAGMLLICCICVDAYHLHCHTPKINKTLNKYKWECSKCQSIKKSKNAAIDEINMNINYENGVEKVRSDELNVNKQNDEILKAGRLTQSKERYDLKRDLIVEKDNSRSKEQKNNKEDTGLKATVLKIFEEEIPDVGDWSCEKLSKYVENYFPREAHVFREHEIDGASLLLMKRSDVVRGLPLLLGPALRLYSFIVRLQSRSNDPRLAWM